jgi:hypothetical protein
MSSNTTTTVLPQNVTRKVSKPSMARYLMQNQERLGFKYTDYGKAWDGFTGAEDKKLHAYYKTEDGERENRLQVFVNVLPQEGEDPQWVIDLINAYNAELEGWGGADEIVLEYVYVGPKEAPAKEDNRTIQVLVALVDTPYDGDSAYDEGDQGGDTDEDEDNSDDANNAGNAGSISFFVGSDGEEE